MGVVEELVQARLAFERREWVAAYDALAAAGPLGADDLDNLGAAAFLLGRKDDYVMAYQRAFQAHVEAGDPLAAVRSSFYLALGLITSGEVAVGSGWVARAARLLEESPEDVVEHGYVQVTRMFRHIGAAEWPEAMELAATITDYGHRFNNADLLATGLAAQGRLATRSGSVEAGLEMLDEAMACITAGDVSPMLAGTLYCALVEACQDLSDFGRAAQWTAALTIWCDSQPGLIPFTGQCAVHRGQIMRLRGAYPEALDEFTRATRRYLEAQTPEPAGRALCERGDVLRLLGEYAEADECYQAALTHGHEPQPGLALLWLARGRDSAALSAVRRLLAEPRDPIGRTQVLPAAVEVLLALQENGDAAVAVEELRAITAGLPCEALHAATSYAAGHLLLRTGQPAESLPELRRATMLWAGLSAPYQAARSRTLVGRALLALGDGDSAVAELEAARVAFSELGATPAEHEVAQLLRPEAPGGLTAREVEVLRLVAAGRTNPEIASMLVLSEKTVARHLSNIFVKLEVTSRTAAAAFAFENRIV